MSDFHSEWRSWGAVFALRKGMIGFFSGIIICLMALFFVMVWEYQIFSAQISQVTNQVEVIAELEADLGQEQIEVLQKEIQQLPMVSQVDYWSPERSTRYIDDRLLSGYGEFLEKTQSGIPLQPLFRIQLTELAEKTALEEILQERYPRQILTMNALLPSEGQSFAQQFISQVDQSTRVFQVAVVLLLVLLVALYAYLVWFLLSERSRGFHLTQMFHLSPAYAFWPALLMTTVLALAFHIMAVIMSFFLLSQVLFSLMLALLVIFLLVNLILVWWGRHQSV